MPAYFPSEWRNLAWNLAAILIASISSQKHSQKGGAAFIKITAKLLPRCSLNKCFFSHCVAAMTARITRKGEKLWREIKRNNRTHGYTDEWQKRRQIFQRSLCVEGIFYRVPLNTLGKPEEDKWQNRSKGCWYLYGNMNAMSFDVRGKQRFTAVIMHLWPHNIQAVWPRNHAIELAIDHIIRWLPKLRGWAIRS